MDQFDVCNRVTGFYVSDDRIEDFKFKVTLKEVHKAISDLHEDPENSADISLSSNVGSCERRLFAWQQKVLANELKDEDLDSSEDEGENTSKKRSNRIISYVHEDDYGFDGDIVSGKATNVPLPAELYNESIQESQEMGIVARINRDTSKQLFGENVLFVLRWYPKQKCLTVTPDFNDITNNPYTLEVKHDSKCLFQYAIEHITEDMDGAKKNRINIKEKISRYQSDIRTRKVFNMFPTVADDTIKYTITLEILSADGFGHGDIYSEYTIFVPDDFRILLGSTKGVTQIATPKGRSTEVHFGHCFELCLERRIQNEKNEASAPRPPRIYFEVVSLDSWDRYRTEGYCSHLLNLDRPGRSRVQLQAINPQGEDKITWEMTRFFIGGHRTLRDITAIGIPETFQGDCLVKHGVSCVSTGRLRIATTVIKQSGCGDRPRDPSRSVRSGGIHVDSLLKSVNAVLFAYKHAREKFKACLDSCSLNVIDENVEFS